MIELKNNEDVCVGGGPANPFMTTSQQKITWSALPWCKFSGIVHVEAAHDTIVPARFPAEVIRFKMLVSDSTKYNFDRENPIEFSFPKKVIERTIIMHDPTQRKIWFSQKFCFMRFEKISFGSLMLLECRLLTDAELIIAEKIFQQPEEKHVQPV